MELNGNERKSMWNESHGMELNGIARNRHLFARTWHVHVDLGVRQEGFHHLDVARAEQRWVRAHLEVDMVGIGACHV